jgi:hypothetical protein
LRVPFDPTPTPDDLRNRIADPRYRNTWHPDHAAFHAETTRLFQERYAETGTVHVRAYTRVVDGKPVQVAAHERTAPEGSADMELAQARTAPRAQVDRSWERFPNPEFRQAIAEAERSAERAGHGYGLRNESGSSAIGRYQLTRDTLIDIGWKNAQGEWTRRAVRHGVNSDADFLARPAAQEEALSDLLRRLETQVDGSFARSFVGQTLRTTSPTGSQVTFAGLLGAAHGVGVGRLTRFLMAATGGLPETHFSAADHRDFGRADRLLRRFGDVAYATMRP